MGTDPGVWYLVAVMVMTCGRGAKQKSKSAGIPIRLLIILYNIIALKLILHF